MTDIVSIPRLDPVQVQFLTQTESIVKEVVESRDFDKGFDFINELHEQGKTFARAIGVVLEGMEGAWKPSEHDGESFYAAALRKTGLSPITVKRHVKIQKALASGVIPPEYQEQIESNHGEKELIRIANLIEGGFEVDDEGWRDLAEAAGEKEVGRIARKIQGVEPRSNWLSISIDVNGRLFVHTSTTHREIGRLFVDDEDPAVQKAINRITGCAGIQPASEY
jgi:hypothetical protein